MTEVAGGAPMPKVSIILPVRNEAAFIARTLTAVLDQDYPHDRLEVFVADGTSTDGTAAIVAAVAAASRDVAITLVENRQGIVSTGLNDALARAHGDIVVRIDGHTIVARDYVRCCVEALQRSGADAVGGRMEAVGETRFARAVAAATRSRFGSGGARFHVSDREEWVDTVYMGAWFRSVFDRYGLFDESLVRNQDDEFHYRLLDGGGRILLCPRIRSQYFARSTAAALWRQYAQYGFWKVRVMRKHPRQVRARQLAAPLFVGSLLTALALAPASAAGRLCAVALASSYVVANVAASLAAARADATASIPLVASVFSILHFAWGSGFLAGLAALAPRRRPSPAAVLRRHGA